MTDSNSALIAKYLASDISAEELQRLRQILADDNEAADALISEAFMDVNLREALSGSELGQAMLDVSTDNARLCATPAIEFHSRRTNAWRSLTERWMVAAVLLVTISGWAVAAYVFEKLGEARSSNTTLTQRIAELENEAIGQELVTVKNNAPEIYSVRGWLMALPQRSNAEGETLLAGNNAPLNRRLWTCPWGAVEFRYDSGVAISVERNTTVKFNDTDELRRLTLERGIVHVTNLSDTDQRPTEIVSALATVQLISGQVAVQADRQRTVVEVAVNHVEITVQDDGHPRTITVNRGQYLIIEPGTKAKVLTGMMILGLEPPKT